MRPSGYNFAYVYTFRLRIDSKGPSANTCLEITIYADSESEAWNRLTSRVEDINGLHITVFGQFDLVHVIGAKGERNE